MQGFFESSEVIRFYVAEYEFLEKAICMELDFGSMRDILYTKRRVNDAGCGFVSISKWFGKYYHLTQDPY